MALVRPAFALAASAGVTAPANRLLASATQTLPSGDGGPPTTNETGTPDGTATAEQIADPTQTETDAVHSCANHGHMAKVITTLIY